MWKGGETVKTLQLVFRAGGAKAMLHVAHPREGLTAATVKAVGDKLAADGVFENKQGVYSRYEAAQIVERTVTPLV